MLKKMACLSPTLCKLVLATAALSLDVVAQAAYANNAASPGGRAQFSAAEANGNLSIFSGDFMGPIANTSNDFFYDDLMGDYGSNNTFLVSPGFGYRTIVNNQIFGAYAFTDYEETDLGENFWVLSPGVEWITPRWDAHMNLYFPTTHSQEDGGVHFIDEYGENGYQILVPNTNDAYNMQVQNYAVIGNGVDTEIGYSFSEQNDLKSRVFLGSYYYQPQGDTDNILGATLGYEKAMTKNLSWSLSNSYDEVNHYALNLGLSLTFGGDSNTYSTNVQDRLLDPVERHIGIIDTGAGTYDQQTTENRGEAFQYNIVEMNPDGSGDESGTVGNAMPFNQTSFDTINQEFPNGVHIYMQGGTTETYVVGNSTNSSSLGDSTTSSYNGITIYAGEELNGRNEGYNKPASSDERPEIVADEGYTAFSLSQGGNNTFSDLNISSLGGDNVHNTTGIYVVNTNSEGEALTIKDTSISGFAQGVFVKNFEGNFTLNTIRSNLNNNGIDGFDAYGLQVWNNSTGDMTVNTTDSQFNNSNATNSNSGGGLYLLNSNTGTLTLNADNSQFRETTSDTGSAYGIYAMNSSTGNLMINANTSSLDHNIASGDSASAFGMYAYNASSGAMTVNLINSTLHENSADGASGNAYGMETVNAGSGLFSINMNTVTFDNNHADALGAGYYAYNAGSGDMIISANKSTFNHEVGTSGGNGVMLYNLNNGGKLAFSATDSSFSHNSLFGLYVYNQSIYDHSLVVSNLSGSTLDNNNAYGVYNRAGEPDDSTTIIDITDATFKDNGIDDHNW